MKKDYQLVKKIFSKFKDPINVSYKTLLKQLNKRIKLSFFK